MPKITNSSSEEASSECSTLAGITATLPGRREWTSWPSVIVPVPEVRRPVGDLDDVDICDAALAARHDPLDVAGQSMGWVSSR